MNLRNQYMQYKNTFFPLSGLQMDTVHLYLVVCVQTVTDARWN